jgi:hypothetical protein
LGADWSFRDDDSAATLRHAIFFGILQADTVTSATRLR